MRTGAAEEAEFEALVMEHHAEIHRYLRRVAARPADADDLSQETFLRAYRAWPCLDREANRRAWLFAIATNLLRNQVRDEQRRVRAHSTERVLRRGVVLDDPEAETFAQELQTLTEATIRGLPVKQRVAFTLRKLHGLDYEIIGESLACSAESSRAHVFQAMRKLRATLDGAVDPRPVRSAGKRR